MKFKNIKECMNHHLGHLNIDKNLIKQLRNFRLGWAQKDPIYTEFLGSNLFGVHDIRFSSNDTDILFVDIFNANYDDICDDVKNTKGVNKKFKVASNGFFHSIIYLVHKYTVSKLPEKTKEEAIRELYYIYAYRIISSLYYGSIVYAPSEATAKAVYERLSNKYLIKKLGSWQKVFEYRAKDLLPGGLHYNRLKSYSTDDAIRVITDTQGRIRETVKNIYSVLDEISKSNVKINTSSTVQEGPDGNEIKDISERPDKFLNYIRSIYKIEFDFVDHDLIYLLGNLTPNLDIENFTKTLKYISHEVDITPDSKDDFISLSILETIRYINTRGITHDYSNHAYDILKLMKGYWSGSSVKDTRIKHIKKYLYKLAGKATGKKTKWLLVTISINVLLYIFLRAITKK